jgi:hypothetical protein
MTITTNATPATALAGEHLEYDIRRLGRWSSEASKGYFHISRACEFYLNRRFQTGRSVPVIQISLNVPNGQDSRS